ncbi:MAG TPA: sigma-70 family RNA polymerase sigma factor [Candidatus Limnocylindria bacterium]|nr:sigma-70 family RNA polymerase sigma factor [Candidatus Limnocylindria bacterium]
MQTDITGKAYDAHHEQLYGYLVSITRDGDVAHDVVQETFARYAREVQLKGAPRETRAWLFRVARNLVISQGRRQQVAARSLGRLYDWSIEPSAEEECLVRERRRELELALAETSPADRAALLMAAQGYSGAQIARAVGISEAAVRTRLCRARGRLRVSLRGAREEAGQPSSASLLSLASPPRAAQPLSQATNSGGTQPQ